MRYICVSVDLKEKVLESYLIRTCNAHIVEKKSLKTIRFPEKNLNMKNKWSIKQFEQFCEATISNKNTFKIYKTTLVKKQEGGGK